MSLIEYSNTKENLACLKFSIILTRSGETASEEVKALYVFQNHLTLRINLRISNENNNIYEFIKASCDGTDNNRIVTITVR